MKEERKKILDMLAEGKINAEQAEALLSAIDTQVSNQTIPTEGQELGKKLQPKYLRIQVLSEKPEKGNEQVNIKVPFQLLRSGIKLASIMPSGVQEKVTNALNEKGIDLDLSKAKNENLEELISDLEGLTVDVTSENESVKIFCE